MSGRLLLKWCAAIALAALCAFAQAQRVPETQVWLAPGAGVKVVAMIAATPQVAQRYDPTQARFSPDPQLVALGRQLFHDMRLSQPQGTSCASCHDPARAFGPDLRRGLRHGETSPGTARGSRAGQFGQRAAPSLMYARYVPRRYFYQDDDALVPSFFGGLMADAGSDSLAEQVSAPLLNPREMNNRSAADLLAHLRRNGVVQMLVPRFGEKVKSDPQKLLEALGASLQAYLQSDELSPFTSKFDRFIRGQGMLDAAELRGLALFKNPDKGNCASCHAVSETASRPERSLFTDFGYEALAAPRNKRLTENRNPRHFDHGLCQTARKLQWPEPEQWCGYVRTPGLRNVAIRQSFMHNGALNSLREVMEFYNTRGTDPARWFGKGGSFDDVAPEFHDNVNVNSPPLNRKPGSPEALTDAEMEDLVAFLRTLTDERYVALMPPDVRGQPKAIRKAR